LEQVEFVEFALKELFVPELGLVFGDEGGAEVAAHGVFDDFGILAGAEQHADGGVAGDDVEGDEVVTGAEETRASSMPGLRPKTPLRVTLRTRSPCFRISGS
jgi:hypothetical protein